MCIRDRLPEHQLKKMGLQKLLLLKEGRYCNADSFFPGSAALHVFFSGQGFRLLRFHASIRRLLRKPASVQGLLRLSADKIRRQSQKLRLLCQVYIRLRTDVYKRQSSVRIALQS